MTRREGVLVVVLVIASLWLGNSAGLRTGRAHGQAMVRPEVEALGREIRRAEAQVAALTWAMDEWRKNLTHEGIASWYGHREAGRPTASGTVFDPEEFTAASKFLPFGTSWRITRLDTEASVVVEITDDGPNRPGRIIDLSFAAARALGMVREGLVRVKVEPIV